MTHKSLVECCELLGLCVSEIHGLDRKTFHATQSRFEQASRVFWSTSDDGVCVIGLPRVMFTSRDTHARSLREVKYLVGLQP